MLLAQLQYLFSFIMELFVSWYEWFTHFQIIFFSKLSSSGLNPIFAECGNHSIGPAKFDSEGVLQESVFDGSKVQHDEGSSSKDQEHSGQVAVLISNDDFFVEFLHCNNITDHVLQIGLEPIQPSWVDFCLLQVSNVEVIGSQMAVKIRLSEVI